MRKLVRERVPMGLGVAGLLAVCAGLTACVTLPTGPSVMVLPGSSVSFEQFQVDDAVCRSFASQRVGATPQQAASESTVAGAAVGTAIGAATGAAIGAASGHPGAGAAAGAGGGLLLGSLAGSSRGDWYASDTQRRYDAAYMQCMYSKGNQIPIPAAGAPMRERARPPVPSQQTPPPSGRPLPPAPPVGPPPPPPPGA